MPRYLLFRAVKERSEEDVEAAALRSIEAMNQMPEVRWIRSYWSVEEGGFYCEYEAPSAELLFEHARRARLTLERVELVRDLEPSMFRYRDVRETGSSRSRASANRDRIRKNSGTRCSTNRSRRCCCERKPIAPSFTCVPTR